MKLTGLILCGGESKRMGADKGTLLKNDVPWVEVVAKLFNQLNLPYKVSVNELQLTRYQTLRVNGELIVDTVAANGPLRGILSAHKRYPDKNWLVLECDMTDMNFETIRTIWEIALTNNQYDFYTYKNESFFEPFCGIYTAIGLKNIYHAFQNGALTKHSLQSVLANSLTLACSINENMAAFTNYNRL